MGTSISCWRATSTAYRPCGGATMRAMACCCAERGGRGGRRSLRCGRPGAERSHDRRAGAASRARQAGRRGPSDRRGAEQRQAADSAPTSPPAARPDLEAVEGSIYVPMDRPRLTFWQMYNMSFGFLGIQFGWGLQLANMSAVYERLGARPDQVPLLWLPAPLTRPLVQAVVGAPSRPPWGRLGRRRPYFLTPGFRRRQARRVAADRRVRDAVVLHRSRRQSGECLAAVVQLVRRAWQHVERSAALGEVLLLGRRRGLFPCRAVDGSDDR